FHQWPTDRGWMRDCAPTIVRRPDNATLELIDWKFNAWAKYDNWHLDDHVPILVERLTGIPRIDALRPDNGERMVCEGGGI
ncbi:agmatine deiminase family protein, partial [Salmonella enterica]|uniref:agmatine deiminase family protein n=1 Tax=Salmonella enterica TaxID=28901 RepID=UPI003D2C3A1A